MTIETYRLTPTQKYIALGLALGLIVLGAAALWYFNKTTPESGVEVTKIEGLPEGTTVEVVDSVDSRLFDSTPRPALDRPLPQSTLPDATYAAMVKNRAEAVAMIKENPALMTQWIGLGAVHKQAGDYEGARIYWNYVATVNPQNLAVHWNLGTLYAYYLKDTTKAEAAFLKAVAVDTSFVPAYLELYLARKAAGKIELAVEALASGIAKNPDDTDLRVALARHYRDAKDVAAARAAYDGAIAAAVKAGDTPLAASLRAEQAAL